MDEIKGNAGRVGFVIFIAMLLLVIGVYIIGGGALKQYIEYKMMFPSVIGLRPNAHIYVSGVPAGKVGNIEFADTGANHILVSIKIETQFGSRIRADSVAWIQSEGLLGDKSICILAGDLHNEQLPPGSTIRVVDKSFIDNFVGQGLMNNATDLLENASKLIKDINQGKGMISQVLRDPEWALQFSRTMTHIEKGAEHLESILNKIDKGEGSIGELVNDASLILNVKDLFLGVRESGLLTNMVRRAERTGRELRIEEEKQQKLMRDEASRVLERVK